MQNFIDQINRLENPTFQKIRSLSYNSISHLSQVERELLREKLRRGIALLDSHELMCLYLYYYGNMHEAKIHHALQEINQKELEHEFDIIDWGCGQGIATIAFFDYVKKHKLNS